METLFISKDLTNQCVRKDFPVGREWKPSRSISPGVSSLSSERTFPLEGNGNPLLPHHPTEIFLSERTFPLEGNGNYSGSILTTLSRGPKGLSRWKGMETRCRFHDLSWRFRPKGLSRWKGMETIFLLISLIFRRQPSERTFPLEGNGNKETCASVIGAKSAVRKDFPVGREWKRNSGRCPLYLQNFGDTFPFEGNGNHVL